MSAAATLGLGCWAFGGKGESAPNDANSSRLLARAVEWGVHHFDTAQDYGSGHSETVIGCFLESHTGAATVGTKTAFTASREEVTARVQDSLRRLKVPTIDLFTIHWPRSDSDPAPMIEALESCRRRGWIQKIGVSNFSVGQMEAARRAGTIDDHQLGYNLAWTVAQDEVIPYCRRHGIPVTVYSPLAQGLLTGRGRDPGRWGAGDPRRKTVFYLPDVWRRVERALIEWETLAESAGMALSDLALRWVLTRPGVSRVLVGASDESQLKANIESRNRAFEDPTVLEVADAISGALAKDLPPVGNIFLYYP